MTKRNTKNICANARDQSGWVLVSDKLPACRSSNGYAYRSSTSWQLVEAPTGTPTDPRQAGSSSKLQRVRLQILDKLPACRSSNGYAYRSSTSWQLVGPQVAALRRVSQRWPSRLAHSPT